MLLTSREFTWGGRNASCATRAAMVAGGRSEHHTEGAWRWRNQIPHYPAKEATEAIKAAFPQLYLYDPTPVWKATLRVAAKCVCVEQDKDGLWVFKQPKVALSA
jgi:hypothetical protein